MDDGDILGGGALGGVAFDAGAAFLGSQGDVWDAQKDILCDTLDALCASTLFLCSMKKSDKER